MDRHLVRGFSILFPIMISVVILTKNSALTLRETLSSLKGFKEVILLDNGSEDDTLSIGKEYPNVKIFSHLFIGFGPLRNLGASYASFDWILSLDSDEVVSPALEKELFSLSLNPKALYSMPFHNFYNGKWIKGCGWYPDRHTRLYHKKRHCFSDEWVHEKVISKNRSSIIDLVSPIEHTSYRSFSDFLKKMELYSSLFAKQYGGKKRSSLFKALYHAKWAFLKSYFLKKGFLDGKEGFIISLYQAQTAYYKYLKLLEWNKKCS